MSIEAPHSEQTAERKFPVWTKRTVAVLGAAAFSLMTTLGIDAQYAKATDTPDGPTTSVVDHRITSADNPEKEAKLTQVDPALIEKCRESRFVTINFSGTGMETSHYAANMIQGIVENLGGCNMYHWYGHIYDPEASAESVEKAVENVTPAGQKKTVVLIGASFGGIVAEDIAMEPVIENSQVMNIQRIIMVATPVDTSDVTDDFFGIPIAWIQDVPVPEFGNLPVLGNAVKGRLREGELDDLKKWNDTFINAAKTRPILMHSELQRIQRGLQKVRPDISVDYAASPDSDQTVNDWQAYQRLGKMVTDAKVSYIEIQGGGHDKGWLYSTADLYNSKVFGPILKELFGQEA